MFCFRSKFNHNVEGVRGLSVILHSAILLSVMALHLLLLTILCKAKKTLNITIKMFQCGLKFTHNADFHYGNCYSTECRGTNFVTFYNFRISKDE
jgi:hypothetical protein